MTLNGVMTVILRFSPNSVDLGADYVMLPYYVVNKNEYNGSGRVKGTVSPDYQQKHWYWIQEATEDRETNG